MTLYGGSKLTPEEQARKSAFGELATLGKVVFQGVGVGAALLIIASVIWIKVPVVECVQQEIDALKALEEAEVAKKLRDEQYTQQSLQEERYKKALADKVEAELAAATGG